MQTMLSHIGMILHLLQFIIISNAKYKTHLYFMIDNRLLKTYLKTGHKIPEYWQN